MYKRSLDFKYWDARLYQDKNGDLRNKIRRGSGKNQQKDAIATTTKGSRGYLVVQDYIDGKLINIYAHRLAWLLHYKEDPGNWTINHKNHLRSDNRIDNLELAAMKDQNEDHAMHSNNTTGVTGVFFYESNKNPYYVQIARKSYGCYSTLLEARLAAQYVYAGLGFSPNHGRPLTDIQSNPA